jgi:hypothetical protein
VRIKLDVDMRNLQRSLKKLGQVPQKHVTASARKGMNIVLKEARVKAPYETGALKKGMKLQGERSRYKGKKVYKIIFDPAMNHIFQKKNQAGEIVAYYPVSQEYGYFTKNGKYIPGFRFIHNSLANNAQKMERTIITTMKQKIDAEIRKVGLK